VEPVLLEVWKGGGTVGPAALGEGTPVDTPAAVLNAVYNPLGVRIDHIPVRPADVLEALDKGGVP